MPNGMVCKPTEMPFERTASEKECFFVKEDHWGTGDARGSKPEKSCSST